MNEANRSNKSAGTSEEEPYRVGYGRPPKHTQFKKGHSGNKKGRPKGSKNMRSEMLKIYFEPVPIMPLKGKRRRVPVLVALERAQVRRGFTDGRAAQAVFRNAKEFGAFDQIETEVCSSSLTLSDEFIDRLTDKTLDELIRIEKELQAEQKNPNKLH